MKNNQKRKKLQLVLLSLGKLLQGHTCKKHIFICLFSIVFIFITKLDILLLLRMLRMMLLLHWILIQFLLLHRTTTATGSMNLFLPYTNVGDGVLSGLVDDVSDAFNAACMQANVYWMVNMCQRQQSSVRNKSVVVPYKRQDTVVQIINVVSFVVFIFLVLFFYRKMSTFPPTVKSKHTYHEFPSREPTQHLCYRNGGIKSFWHKSNLWNTLKSILRRVLFGFI